MIDQYSFYIEQCVKNSEGKWVLTEYDSDSAKFMLESIDAQIALPYLYDGVNFDIEAEE